MLFNAVLIIGGIYQDSTYQDIYAIFKYPSVFLSDYGHARTAFAEDNNPRNSDSS